MGFFSDRRSNCRSWTRKRATSAKRGELLQDSKEKQRHSNQVCAHLELQLVSFSLAREASQEGLGFPMPPCVCCRCQVTFQTLPVACSEAKSFFSNQIPYSAASVPMMSFHRLLFLHRSRDVTLWRSGFLSQSTFGHFLGRATSISQNPGNPFQKKK